MWRDPIEWEARRSEATCPVCRGGRPPDTLVELDATWVISPARAALPGYACLISKRHANEPFDLPEADRAAFWDETNRVAAALDRHLSPVKINYEIHGNTIPHLHMHLFPRQVGDRFEGRPIDGSDQVDRTDAELAAVRDALAPLADAGRRRGSP